MRLRQFAFAAFTALLLAGCAAPTSSSGAPKAPAVDRTTPSPAAPAPAVAPAPKAPDAQAPDTRETAPGLNASNPSRSCRTDSDCAVKDVGNCCGAYPMCVNKDARTNPAAVRAQCEKDGMASICGFQEVSGCQCVKGRCENISNGSAVM